MAEPNSSRRSETALAGLRQYGNDRQIETLAIVRKAIAALRLGGARVTLGSIAEATKPFRSEEHTSELQSLMRISYAVFCLKKKKQDTQQHHESKTTITHKSIRAAVVHKDSCIYYSDL